MSIESQGVFQETGSLLRNLQEANPGSQASLSGLLSLSRLSSHHQVLGIYNAVSRLTLCCHEGALHMKKSCVASQLSPRYNGLLIFSTTLCNSDAINLILAKLGGQVVES